MHWVDVRISSNNYAETFFKMSHICETFLINKYETFLRMILHVLLNNI